MVSEIKADPGNPLLVPACLPDTVFDHGMESWMGRHEAVCRAVEQGDPEVVFIGDSITHFWEDTGREAWDMHFARFRPVNMGFGGDRIQHVLWRLQHGELAGIAPKVAVLLIGTNNSADNEARHIAEGIGAICSQIRRRLPQTRVLLLAIFPRDTPGDPRRKVNEAVNGLIAGLDDGEWIFFRDIGGFLLNGAGYIREELMDDLLHPTAAGYTRFAEALCPILNELFTNTQQRTMENGPS